MKMDTRRLRAAFLLAVLAVPVRAQAQAQAVEVPAYRQLGASEAMTEPGKNGTDYSANAPSLSGLTLLATMPAPAVPRLGYFIQAQCTAGLSVVFDDAAGGLAPTVVVLAGAAANGGQGGSLSMAGMPHTGRIRIYSSGAGCQMAARSW
ncbi:MAG TPA: hypothetical protein VHY35_08685 [Stellaceae bacterium]|jgi:hypothetical protein|nr:hypothetical protein [Stellaceae bacterium]